MTAILLRRRMDRPGEAGFYVVRRAGGVSPQVAHWSERDGCWREGGRRLAVEAWADGLIVPPGEVREVGL